MAVVLRGQGGPVQKLWNTTCLYILQRASDLQQKDRGHVASGSRNAMNLVLLKNRFSNNYMKDRCARQRMHMGTDHWCNNAE